MRATLYVVGAPASDPDDLTLRASRILSEVALVAAEDAGRARQLLDHHDIPTPLHPADPVDVALEALASGDVALLLTGWAPGPTGAAQQLIRAAIEAGFAATPVPGPALPITALVVSGLPADGFFYLGEWPTPPDERQALLAALAAERRTLVFRASLGDLPEILADLRNALGSRPLAVSTPGNRGGVMWRGATDEAHLQPWSRSPDDPVALIVGGARETTTRWSEEQLLAEIRAELEQGRGAKEISQQLVAKSGWRRRAIYRRVVELAQADE